MRPKLKEPKDFKLIGKPLKRHDTPDKSDGKTSLITTCAKSASSSSARTKHRTIEHSKIA
jgi:hypothetical protein